MMNRRQRGRGGVGLRFPAVWLTLALAIAVSAVPARAQVAVRGQGFVPFSEEPINYLTNEVNDPVARLQKKLDEESISLTYKEPQGYLKAVLDFLEIPISSQTLVFSKTSFQYRKISPNTPRALYFNDDVYVGWVRDGKALEIASFDPKQGAIFYLLDQQPTRHPTFLRAELDCTQCHVAAGTRGIPGVLLRSVYPTANGNTVPGTASFVTGHESPLKERFGGWYVTGAHGDQRHLGNAVVADRDHPELDTNAGANVTDLSSKFNTSDYLSKDSDLVAQLVLAHQTQMHNLITLVNYKTRITLHAEAKAGRAADALSEEAQAQYKGPAEELLKYLLFVDEARLDGPIAGTSSFAREFAARGPRDPQGRSLREFDLKRRLFRYPCSYLIGSDAFDALPNPARDYIYSRLLEVLTGRDRSPAFAHLANDDRRAIFEILVATKPGLPGDWKHARFEASTSSKPEAAPKHAPTTSPSECR